MPAAMIYSMARKYGVSRDRAEGLWDKAKQAAVGSKLKSGGSIPRDEKSWSSKHFAYVTGIFKRMLSSQKESFVESLIELAVKRGASTVVEVISQGDLEVRAFFDSGELVFATIEDVLLTAEADPRIQLLYSIVNDVDWPDDHPVFETLDGYEGSLQQLLLSILAIVGREDEEQRGIGS